MREMKNSGIDWIGEIPTNWNCCKQKYEIRLINGRAYSESEFEENGTYRILRVGNLFSNPTWYTSSMELPEEKYCEKGDLLYSWSMSYAPVVWQGEKVIYHYHIWKTALSKRMCKMYVYYYLLALTDSLKAEIHETTMGFITMGVMNNSYITVPPIAEQHKISNFLDAKCSEIDSLSADIQAQIDALEQYKRSVITETVTKGLNPDAVKKNSGIQWIGTMPSHWNCIRGKYILKYIQKPVREDDGVITCFRDGEVTLRSNRREDGFTMADKEIGYQGIDIGDLVVHGMDGFAGAIGISDSRGKASPVLNVLDTEQNKRYIMYFLRSMAYSDVFLAMATGIRVRSCDLRWNKLAELFYPVPPIEEQEAIVEYIDSVLTKANDVIAAKKEQLSVLEACKKSLIFEYVTGKKEVPAPITAVMVDPNVILLGKLPKLLSQQKGKIYNQKVLYLLNIYLGLNLGVQYCRYKHGPYDIMLDSYIDTLVENGWCVKTVNNGAENLDIGPNYGAFEEKYGSCFSEYNTEINRLIQFVQPMKRSQIERVATLFAVWNDMILDGNSAPTDTEIVSEVLTGWTENKANFAYDTWISTLNKMRSNGIIPKGQGLHTLPKDC